MLEKAPFWVSGASALIQRLPYGRYRSLRYLGVFSRKPFLATLSTSSGGAKFVADLRDSICREACFTGQYEPQETLLIKTILAPGMSFLDVGANWGYFTLLAAARVGSSGTVVSLEPDPRLFKTLSQNVHENGFTQVSNLAAAAAAVSGTLGMKGYDETGNNWGISQVVTSHENSAFNFEVSAVTLDEIITTFFPNGVDVVKMDIEGAEDLALLGLNGCLRKGLCRAIILELHPSLLERKGTDCQTALKPLLDNHYQIYRIDHSDKMTRCAAYSRLQDAQSLLSPIATTETFDLWPHLFCLAPQVSLAKLCAQSIFNERN